MNHVVDRHALVEGHRIAHGVDGAGEPVVLVHGTPSSSYIWRDVVPRLVEAGYRTHVFDLLGYGLSERPWDTGVDTSITGNVSVLEGMLDEWGLDTFHLVAHDIGGGIAQRFGVRSPERLRTLTLIDVVSFDSYPSERTRQQMADGPEALAKRPNDEHREHFREWLLSTHSDPAGFDPEALRTYLDFISGPVGQPSFFQHQAAHYDPVHTMEISDRLHTLGEIPVQLIWGADDTWQILDRAHRLQRAIPGSGLHVIEDCGHFAPEERPAEVAAAVLGFLGQSGS
ncbi:MULTISPECIES: alpha/beta hydrolase [unclassified Dietzia]|uniref:alpha/beta fold hydrolase n=1 Tax=unclassified Dietzia TaxID=2617939 RepID=UPI0015FB6AC7|nr:MULTISPECIES: alpha/beta hydrolase [unclassified Dietzia]MBB1042080.1 alpha/beta hydrolase [Dietzia sp. Cai40]MBB1046180.1 alpha/beta hydrolase [Dietzia sp. DQ11-44]MBB1049797.1 alpha/beta hydrolase [Dietzia sp. CW19]